MVGFQVSCRYTFPGSFPWTQSGCPLGALMLLLLSPWLSHSSRGPFLWCVLCFRRFCLLLLRQLKTYFFAFLEVQWAIHCATEPPNFLLFKKMQMLPSMLTQVEENQQYTKLWSLYSRCPKITFRVNLAKIRELWAITLSKRADSYTA